jgi:hypothetical protein
MKVARFNTLTFLKVFAFSTIMSGASLSYKSALISPGVNAFHLRPFHNVCSKPYPLELALILNSR